MKLLSRFFPANQAASNHSDHVGKDDGTEDTTMMMDTTPAEFRSTLQVMLLQESRHYWTSDSVRLHGQQKMACRQMMVQWFQQMIDSFEYSTEIYEIAVSIMDRYMLTPSSGQVVKTQNKYVLMAVTAFYIAAKAHAYLIVTPKELCQLSDYIFVERDFETMESIMLPAIEWRVNPPTSIAFITELVKLLPFNHGDNDNGDEEEHEEDKKHILRSAKFQAMMAIGDSHCLGVKKSLIAFAAVENALDLLHIPMDTADLKMALLLQDTPPHLGATTTDHCIRQDDHFLPQVKSKLVSNLLQNKSIYDEFMLRKFAKQVEQPLPNSPRSVTAETDDTTTAE